ncbi:MAG: hypothetical protein AB7I38_19025 [Dehalococcoidia bacterium]
MNEQVSVGRNQVLAAPVPIVIALVWVGLTWRTGLTYHFMPLAVAASGAAVARWFTETGLSRAVATRYAVWSVVVVVVAWIVMVAGEFDPAGTFVSGQPGGVIGEVVAFSFLGALWSVRYALRR